MEQSVWNDTQLWSQLILGTTPPDRNVTTTEEDASYWVEWLSETLLSTLGLEEDNGGGNRRPRKLRSGGGDAQARLAHTFLMHRSRQRRQLLSTDDDELLRRRRRRRLNETLSNDNNDNENNDAALYTFLDDASTLVRTLLRNPIPVPTLREYVFIARQLQRLLDNYRRSRHNDTAVLDRIWAESRYGQQWGNLLTLGTLHVSPARATRAEQWLALLKERYPDVVRVVDGPTRHRINDDRYLWVRLHDSEAEAIDYIDRHAATERTWALLDLAAWPVVNNSATTTTTTSSEPPSYKIRMNYTTLPNTAELVEPVTTGLNEDFELYFLSGFLTLQRTLNEFAFAVADDEETDNCYSQVWEDHQRVLTMPFPTQAYGQNAFYATVGPLLGLTITMAFLFPVARLIKVIVEEKEQRQRELLFVMGLRPWAHWWSWLLTALATFAVIDLLVTWTLSAQVLKYSSFGYLLLWIGLFSTASIGFCFTIASLFFQSKLAAITGPIMLFATLLPRFIFFGSNQYEDVTAKKWASLLPATAFALGADVIADYEYAEIGIHSLDATEGNYSLRTAMSMLLIDTFLYLFLGWYIDQVIPRAYGKPQPFYFLLSPYYWCGDLLGPRPQGRDAVDDHDDDKDDDSASASSVQSWSASG